ncbi:hypothetical protein HETIRDRAFT_451505 [Heterobasidion irregulare TC 32-1]|uniref:Uncharacterized protein n=1 Tax=Heterobasidion irregulare (strain TC 32-1) TaxID=747525 RepID=W4K7T2_HETIT|nr:uncharacterized protein HETIRDRAFT_451505 [Heterobasidion irregulare TC 32-1]ETW81799.1 hypothetical protein HETIRDRAFT_451505 [Heterobasidion irregulare TC 32-1]
MVVVAGLAEIKVAASTSARRTSRKGKRETSAEDEMLQTRGAATDTLHCQSEYAPFRTQYGATYGYETLPEYGVNHPYEAGSGPSPTASTLSIGPICVAHSLANHRLAPKQISHPGAAPDHVSVQTAHQRRAGGDEDEDRAPKRPRHAVDPAPPDPRTDLVTSQQCPPDHRIRRLKRGLARGGDPAAQRALARVGGRRLPRPRREGGLRDGELRSPLEAIRGLIEAGRSQSDDIEDGIDRWVKQNEGIAIDPTPSALHFLAALCNAALDPAISIVSVYTLAVTYRGVPIKRDADGHSYTNTARNR